MARYRKRPVVIEAEQLIPGPYIAEKLAKWCGGSVVMVVRNSMYPSWTPFADLEPDDQTLTFHFGWAIDIPTLEGTMRAMPGDYIIQGVQGEFYPCRADIFEQTYELVEDDHENNQDNRRLPGACSLLPGKRTT